MCVFTPGLLRGSFVQISTPKSCTHLASPPIRAACSTHAIIFYLIAIMIFAHDYRSLSSSLCNILQSPVTSPPLGSNMFLKISLYTILIFRNTDETARATKQTGTKLNSVALVRTRTIPTERPPPVGEVSANFRG